MSGGFGQLTAVPTIPQSLLWRSCRECYALGNKHTLGKLPHRLEFRDKQSLLETLGSYHIYRLNFYEDTVIPHETPQFRHF